jgi:hypothetical protein
MHVRGAEADPPTFEGIALPQIFSCRDLLGCLEPAESAD